MFERIDPPFPNIFERNGIEVVKLLPALPDTAHQIGRFEYGQVLRCRLARHCDAFAQLPQRLSVVFSEAIEQESPCRVGQGLED